MAFLLKVLSDMLQNPQLLSHIHVPNQNSNSAPPKFHIRRHRVQLIQPLPETLINSVSPMGSQSHRDGLTKLSGACCIYFGPTGISNQSHRVCLTNSLFSLLPKSVPPSLCNRSNRVCLTNSLEILLPNRSHRVCVIGPTEIMLCPNPNHIGLTELHFGPTENPNGHIIC